MKGLSIVIPSYNNLRHLKNAYSSIRKWYPEVELILMDDGSDDGTWDWLGEIDGVDGKVTKYRTDERLGHTILYDVGIDMATNDVVGIIHADMLVTENTFENMMKHLERGKVVCATRVEPPLHPPGDEKIIKNFGIDFDSLDVESFESYAKRQEKEYKDETTNGMFAPWIIYKEDFVKMGGHDHIFAPFPYEDSDIFQRWILEGYELIQARDSFVYHLTCRGHRWNDEIGKNDDEYKKFETNAREWYIRKWGTWIQNTNTQYPIITPKYEIGMKIDNLSYNDIKLYELWSSFIYTDNVEGVEQYIDDVDEEFRPMIAEKFLGYDMINYDETIHEPSVLIEFDANEMTPELYNGFIPHVNRIVDEGNYGEGTFEWEIFKITINNTEPFGKNHFDPIYKKDI